MHRRALRERLVRDFAQAVLRELVDLLAIDAVLERLTHLELGERRRRPVLVLQPELELQVGARRLLRDREPLVTLDRLDGVDLGADHVDVTGLERGDRGRAGRDLQEVDARHVFVDALVPVVRVLDEQDLRALVVGLQHEGPGTNRVLVGGREARGLHHHAVAVPRERVQDLDRLIARQHQLDVSRVDNLVALDQGDRAQLRVLAVLNERLADGFGIEGLAVTELQARTQGQVELASLRGRGNRPRRCEARLELSSGRLVEQRVVDEGGDDLVAVTLALRHVERVRPLRVEVVSVPQHPAGRPVVGPAGGDHHRDQCERETGRDDLRQV